MVCLFGFKDPTHSLIYPCHFLLPLGIADSFREVAGNVISRQSLIGSLFVAVEVLAVVYVGRSVDEAFRAIINSWLEVSF